jgi:hypothetical protein
MFGFTGLISFGTVFVIDSSGHLLDVSTGNILARPSAGDTAAVTEVNPNSIPDDQTPLVCTAASTSIACAAGAAVFPLAESGSLTTLVYSDLPLDTSSDVPITLSRVLKGSC